MKLRLQEVEVGVSNLEEGRLPYHALFNTVPVVDQPALAVWNAGVPGIDFNLSSHLPPGKVCLSFLTPDLDEVEDRLRTAGIAYTPPQASHLGMRSLSLQDANGMLIRVNTPTEASPGWLRELVARQITT